MPACQGPEGAAKARQGQLRPTEARGGQAMLVEEQEVRGPEGRGVVCWGHRALAQPRWGAGIRTGAGRASEF